MSYINLAVHFQDVFQRLLARENIDLYSKDMSMMFEGIAQSLLSEIAGRDGQYFDGVVGLTVMIRSPRQIEFAGEMWVGDVRTQKQWLEQFRSVVTDKRCTKQGIWIAIWIGKDRAEGELSSVFRKIEGTNHVA